MHSLKASQRILCRYTNPTSKIQVIKITNISHCFFERAVVPYGSVLFETDRTAHLEIHTGEMTSAILSDVIPCTQLTNHSQKYKQRHHRVAQMT